MGYALIDEDKLEMLFTELREQRALLINLQPVKPEPNPREPWTAKMIADACGWNEGVIRRKINNAGIPKLKDKPVTIEYRHIKQLKLKNFKA